MNLVYVIAEAPSTTQTFVFTEIKALRRLGVHVEIFPLKGSRTGDLESARPSLSWAVRQVSRMRLRHAGALRRCLAMTLIGRPGAPGLLRQLYAILKAMELASQLPLAETTHLHAHFFARTADVACYAALLSGGTYSGTAHAGEVYHPSNVLRTRALLTGARFVACVSSDMQKRVRQLAPETDVIVVHCSFDQTACLISGSKSRRGKELLHLVTVGRLVPKKGWLTILAAASELHRRNSAFHWDWIGDGPLGPFLADAVLGATLSDHVTMHGALSNRDALRWVAGASAFVLPCERATDGDVDGIPVAIMEAGAVRTPVISCDVGGISELVEDGVTGVLVPSSNAQALVEAILELADSPQWANELAQAAQVRVRELFDADTEAARLLAKFRSAGLIHEHR